MILNLNQRNCQNVQNICTSYKFHVVLFTFQVAKMFTLLSDVTLSTVIILLPKWNLLHGGITELAVLQQLASVSTRLLWEQTGVTEKTHQRLVFFRQHETIAPDNRVNCYSKFINCNSSHFPGVGTVKRWNNIFLFTVCVQRPNFLSLSSILFSSG